MRTYPLAAAPILLATFGCLREMPPAAPPPREVPRVEEAVSPPPPGSASVILDANGEAAHVEEVTGTAHGMAGGTAVLTRRLCSTLPCTVNLQNGEHELLFISDASMGGDDRGDTVNVRVTDSPKVVRRAIGHSKSPPAGQVGGAFVGLGLVSAIFCWIPFLVGAVSTGQATKNSWNTTGVVMAAGGGIFVGLGAILMIAAPTEHTPGTTTEWTLTPQGPAPPMKSALFTF
jgi:hypothetical protein